MKIESVPIDKTIRVGFDYEYMFLITLENPETRREMKKLNKWIDENIKGHRIQWGSFALYYIVFQKNDDASLFKLTWC